MKLLTKLLALTLLLALILPVAGCVQNTKGVCNTVGVFQSGSGDDQIGFFVPDTDGEGVPASCFVVDESGFMAIYDSVNSRIVVYAKDSEGNFKYNEQIPTNDIDRDIDVGAGELIYSNGVFYLSSRECIATIKYELNSGDTPEYNVYTSDSFPCHPLTSVIPEGGGVYYMTAQPYITQAGQMPSEQPPIYLFKDGEMTESDVDIPVMYGYWMNNERDSTLDLRLYYGDEKFTLAFPQGETMGLVGADTDGCVYMMHSKVDPETAEGGNWLRKYDMQGNLLYDVEVISDVNKLTFISAERYQIMADGTVYVMTYIDNCVTIFEVE